MNDRYAHNPACTAAIQELIEQSMATAWDYEMPKLTEAQWNRICTNLVKTLIPRLHAAYRPEKDS